MTAVNLDQINAASKLAQNAEKLKEAVEMTTQAIVALNAIARETGIIVRYDLDSYANIDFHVDGVSEDEWNSSSMHC